MEQLEEILSRTRLLARTKALDVQSATQLAIDRAAEVHNGPLDEALLSEQANLELGAHHSHDGRIDNPKPK